MSRRNLFVALGSLCTTLTLGLLGGCGTSDPAGEMPPQAKNIATPEQVEEARKKIEAMKGGYVYPKGKSMTKSR